MVLLTLFAFVAGAAIAVTPCAAPVLPALLSASAVGGRRRPLGIALGLTITYTFAVVALASIVRGVGLASGATRTLAVVVLICVGVVMLSPALAARLEAPLSRLGRFGPKSRGDGFRSGLLVGGALGFVYAPCAGPILAAVIGVSATRGTNLSLVVLALAYALGSATVLGALAYGGRWIIDRIRGAGRGPQVQRVLGAIVLLTALAMATNLDIRFEKVLADGPSFLSNPTQGLESSSAVTSRLRSVSGAPRFDSTAANVTPKATSARAATDVAALHGVKTPELPRLGAAPEFVGTQRWFNTPGDRPLTLAGLHAKHRVVLVDFWTYTCINCLRTLPFVTALADRYRSAGLTVVGVHTPELAFEHNAASVANAIDVNHIHYPVAQDNDYATWNAWGNRYWPAEYLVDADGQVRHTQFGEGDYKESEAAVRTLLVDAGAKRLPAPVTATAELPAATVATPETYLGAEHPDLSRENVTAGTRTFPPAPAQLPLNSFWLSGPWHVGAEPATSTGAGARIDATFQAQKVYLVMSSAGERPRGVRVLLDGKPVSESERGADARDATATVRLSRLYNLVSLPRVEKRRLTLEVPRGVSGYAFTFG